MRKFLLVFLCATACFAQQPPQLPAGMHKPEKVDRARIAKPQTNGGTIVASGFYDVPQHWYSFMRHKTVRVEVQFNAQSGRLLCWVKDLTEPGLDLKVDDLTASHIIFEAPEGHLIDWKVAQR